MGLSAVGLMCLFAICLYELFFHTGHPLHSTQCLKCTNGDIASQFTLTTYVNILGGILLASAHVRNYRLCRRSQCEHDD